MAQTAFAAPRSHIASQASTVDFARQEMVQASGTISETVITPAYQSASDLAAAVADIQKQAATVLPQTINATQSQVAFRIQNQGSVRAAVVSNMANLTGQVSTSVTAAFSTAQALRNNVRAAQAAARNNMVTYATQSVNTLVSLESARVTGFSATITAAVSAMISTNTLAISPAIAVEASSADFACTSLVQTAKGLNPLPVNMGLFDYLPWSVWPRK